MPLHGRHELNPELAKSNSGSKLLVITLVSMQAAVLSGTMLQR